MSLPLTCIAVHSTSAVLVIALGGSAAAHCCRAAACQCAAHSLTSLPDVCRFGHAAVLLPKPQPKCSPPALEGFSPDALEGDFIVAWTAPGESVCPAGAAGYHKTSLSPGPPPVSDIIKCFGSQRLSSFTTQRQLVGISGLGVAGKGEDLAAMLYNSTSLRASLIDKSALLSRNALQPPARATGRAAVASPSFMAPCATCPAVSGGMEQCSRMGPFVLSRAALCCAALQQQDLHPPPATSCGQLQLPSRPCTSKLTPKPLLCQQQ